MTEEEKKRMQDEALLAGAVFIGRVAAQAAGSIVEKILDKRREANRPVDKGMIVADSTDLNALVKVILYQPESGFEATVLLDDLPLAKIDGRQFLITWVKPGKHVFLSEHADQYVQGNFVLGNVYYLLLEPSFWMGKMQVIPNSEKWRKVATKLKPVKVKQIMDRAGSMLLA